MDTNSAEVIQKTPYALMGGEEPLRRLVKRFYEIVDSDPMAAPIRAMHK
ncbi:MAG: globin, partial [Rhodospirillaceae bacterium]|nr:globin [Rhodospirillaceae bacterium]